MSIQVTETEEGAKFTGSAEDFKKLGEAIAGASDVPAAVLPFGLLKGVKISPKEGDKPACMDIALRVPVDEDVMRAQPLLMRLMQRGIMVSAIVSQAQLSFGDKLPDMDG